MLALEAGCLFIMADRGNGYEQHKKRHFELLQLISDIWDHHRRYENFNAEMSEMYLIGQSLHRHENVDIELIGKRTKQLVRQIDEYIVLSRYYSERSVQIKKQIRSLGKIMNAMVGAIIKLEV